MTSQPDFEFGARGTIEADAKVLKQIQLRVIRPDDVPDEILIERAFEGEEFKTIRPVLCRLLRCEYPERIRVFADWSGGTDYGYLDMFVDELSGDKGLPLNRVATEHYRRNMRAHDPGKPLDDVIILGIAVLCDRPVWGT